MITHFGPHLMTWSVMRKDRPQALVGAAVVDADTALVIDPPPADGPVLAALKALAPKHLVVLTSAGHVRAARPLAAALRTRIWAPRADAALLNMPHQAYADGHAFTPHITAVTLAGMKTPGESALFAQHLDTIIIGDALVADPVDGLRLPAGSKIADTRRAYRSLERLAALPFDVATFGHGFAIQTGAGRALARFLRDARADAQHPHVPAPTSRGW